MEHFDWAREPVRSKFAAWCVKWVVQAVCVAIMAAVVIWLKPYEALDSSSALQDAHVVEQR
ncbi:MAG TPA: hypothetical protein VM512_11620 [Burkholderiaceae bacterium]|jgi:hypothetical protein|nr:hypothetical protein [Burkholderiaceae bacterium]